MKYFVITICLVSAIISFSCQEDFSPKAVFKEQYILNCIIRGDSTMQVATLGKTYDVSGFDPSTNNIDPSISGAQVFIKWHGQVFQMRDSSIARTDTSRYKGPLKFYYTTAFTPSYHDSVEITAIPKAGVILNSSTRVPNGVFFHYSPTYISPSDFTLFLSWIETDGSCLYLPRLKILYQKRNEKQLIIHSLDVPLTYNVTNDVSTPVYPGVSEAAGLEFQRNMIDDYMLKVSEGDDKDNYQFLSLQLDLLVFDQFLAGYISSTNGFLDNLSIRLDEPNYTNVAGGLGIFGAYIYNSVTIGLSSDYLLMLGYTP